LSSRKKKEKADDWNNYPFLTQLGIELISRYSPARTHLGFGQFASYREEGEDVWRIGYGSLKISKHWVGAREKATQEAVYKQLVIDLKEFSNLVAHYVVMPLNQKKKAAVLSYAHSIGMPAFKECELLQLINSRASKKDLIREWSPYINRKEFYPENLRERRRVELNTYLAADKKVPLFIQHNCQLRQCLLNVAENYNGTPNQVKAIEYLERKLLEWDPSQEVVRRFFRYWNQEQGGLGSPKTL
jgi:hypothetical protein